MMDFHLFINGLSLTFSCIGSLLSSVVLLFICTQIRPLKSDISLILTCNTYLISIVSSLIMIKQASETIRGILYSWTSYPTANCQINGYFIYIALGSVFYSFLLQDIYRLVRIFFYRKKSLYSLRVFSVAIILQWASVFLLNLPFLLLDDMQYISSEYRCQIPLTSVRGCLLVLFIEYSLPMTVVLTIYFYIIRYIRRTNNRIGTHRHDLLVFKQLIIIFVIVEMLALPLCVLWLLYITQNYLTPLSYQLQSVTCTFSQAVVPIILAYTTPQIREKFKKRRQIHPVLMNRNRNREQRF